MEITMKDILSFKKMITPLFIEAIFYLGVLFVVAGGLIALFHHLYVTGIFMIIICPIIIRIFCELMILMFRIYDRLVEIRDRQGV